eukprot:scaffold53_cov193-Pinguiococcus_pyrenoidosus.AAC.22
MFDPKSHLTEKSYLATPDSRVGRPRSANASSVPVDLFNEWSYFWPLHDPEKKVLLEKSPPNMRTSRFLQVREPSREEDKMLRDAERCLKPRNLRRPSSTSRAGTFDSCS